MNFINNLKQVAQQIIELSAQMDNDVHTWEQQADRVGAKYTDRAGFLSYSDVELCADVFLQEDQPAGLLRARLAYAPGDTDVFTIITLHFDTDNDKTAKLINDRSTISQSVLIELLHENSTMPILIHVSLESGPGGDGKRFEYATEHIKSLTSDEQKTFMTTLQEAFSYITKDISS